MSECAFSSANTKDNRGIVCCLDGFNPKHPTNFSSFCHHSALDLLYPVVLTAVDVRLSCCKQHTGRLLLPKQQLQGTAALSNNYTPVAPTQTSHGRKKMAVGGLALAFPFVAHQPPPVRWGASFRLEFLYDDASPDRDRLWLYSYPPYISVN